MQLAKEMFGGRMGEMREAGGGEGKKSQHNKR